MHIFKKPLNWKGGKMKYFSGWPTKIFKKILNTWYNWIKIRNVKMVKSLIQASRKIKTVCDSDTI